MGNSIAKASLVLGTDSAALYQGLNESGAKMRAWATQTATAVKTQLSKAGQGGTGIFGAVAGGLRSAGTALIAYGTMLAAQQVTRLVEDFKELSQSVSQTGKDAQRLGASGEFIMGLQHAAVLSGIDVEQLRKALMKFRQTATGKFDEAFLEFADRIKSIEDPTIRAQLAMSKFGKGGVMLLSMLDQGSEGIKAFIKDGKAIGTVLSDEDAAKVQAYSRAWLELSLIWKGFATQSLKQFAPAMKEFVLLMKDLAGAIKPNWHGLGEDIRMIIFMLRDAVQYLSKIYKLEDFQNVLMVLMPGFGLLKSNIRDVAQFFAYFWDAMKIGGGVFGKVLQDMMLGLADLVDVTGRSLKKLIDQANKIAPLHARIDTDGMDQWGAGIRKAAQQNFGWADNLLNSWGSTWKTWVGYFDTLRDRAKAAANAGRPIPESNFGVYHPTAAAIQGSREALAIEAKFVTEGMLQKQTEDINKQQLQEIVQIKELLKNMIQAPPEKLDLGLLVL